MQSINVLTIDAELEDRTDPVRIVEEAKGYFPAEAWDEIRYLGKLTLERDVKILIGQQYSDGFLFEKLVKRFAELVDDWRLQDLLLGITTVPVVATYYSFDGRQFRRTVYLVHDYVAKKVGVVSLFCVNEESSSKVVAHGLGHNRGLRHHLKPVDLMHPELLRIPKLHIEGFCRLCLRELTGDKNPQQKSSEH